MKRNSFFFPVFGAGVAVFAGFASIGVSGSEAVFFPSDRFDEFTENWYSGALRALEEPPLHGTGRDEDSYRFIYFRSFHSPVSVRATYSGEGRASLTARMVAMKGARERGKLLVDATRSLSVEEADALRKRLAFLEDCASPEPVSGRDGAMWVFEYSSGPDYCVVEDWSPKSGPWREVGVSMLGAAGLTSRIGPVY